jgi:hypothetical protein
MSSLGILLVKGPYLLRQRDGMAFGGPAVVDDMAGEAATSVDDPYNFSLPRQEGDRSVRVEKHGTGLLVDLSDDGRSIGIEIAIPSLVTVEAVNKILEAYGLDRIDEAELAPLRTAV